LVFSPGLSFDSDPNQNSDAAAAVTTFARQVSVHATTTPAAACAYSARSAGSACACIVAGAARTTSAADVVHCASIRTVPARCDAARRCDVETTLSTKATVTPIECNVRRVDPAAAAT
jgi:hypothetical protein